MVLGLLGEGGMARVYRAEQRSLKRPVALKVIRRLPGEGQDVVNRFQREKEVMQKLEHPHILPIFDYAGNAEYLWIAMRLVEAGTLEDWFKQGRIELPRVARAVSQLAAALDFAHQQGVIHRDLKPSNVLVDQGDHLYLTDFGVAKLIEQEGLTLPGTALGTPGYMAPEQIQGSGSGGSIDQYALAVMAYQMVTGKLPFRGQLVDVLHQHVTQAPPSPRQLRPDLPVEAEKAILKALSKDPQERFPSNAEFAQALAAALQPGATGSQKFAAVPHLPQANKKNLGLLAIPLVLAGAWFFWPAPSSKSFPLVYEVRHNNASEIQLRAPDGKVRKVGTGLAPHFWPQGRYLSSNGRENSVQRIDLAADKQQLLLANASGLVVAPDESFVVFGRAVNGKVQLHRQALVQSLITGNPDVLTRSASNHQGPTLSPDGRKVAYFVDEADHLSIWTLEIENGQRKSLAAPAVGENDSWPCWSPDGSRIAFQRKLANGNLELRVVSSSGQGESVKVPLPKECGGPQTPTWNPSTDIAFRTDQGIYSVGADGKRFRLLVESPGGNARVLNPCWGPIPP